MGHRHDNTAGHAEAYKDVIYKGSFDKYAGGKGKKGTAEADDALLEEVESWRDTLAR